MSNINRESVAAIQKLIVHNGLFHADDVGCFAVLRILNPELQVIRTRNIPEESPDTIVADVGLGKYDHHQEDTPVRPDGVKNCALSLIWDDFGPYVIEKMTGIEADSADNADACEQIYQNLIRTIAMEDNGVAITSDFRPFTIGAMVGGFNTNWNEPSTPDDVMQAFLRAADMFTSVFMNEVKRVHGNIVARCEVTAAVEKAQENGSKIVVLDRFAPWQRPVCESEALIVMYPPLNGGYNIQMVPTRIGTFETRIQTPEDWRNGQNAPAGMTFAHKAGFLAAFKDKESALAAAKALVGEE